MSVSRETSTHRASHQLRALGWPLSQIGAELGISRQAVHQHLQIPLKDEEAMLRELQGELSVQLTAQLIVLEDARRQVQVLRRRILEVDDRLESRRVDRILGFTG